MLSINAYEHKGKKAKWIADYGLSRLWIADLFFSIRNPKSQIRNRMPLCVEKNSQDVKIYFEGRQNKF